MAGKILVSWSFLLACATLASAASPCQECLDSGLDYCISTGTCTPQGQKNCDGNADQVTGNLTFAKTYPGYPMKCPNSSGSAKTAMQQFRMVNMVTLASTNIACKNNAWAKMTTKHDLMACAQEAHDDPRCGLYFSYRLEDGACRCAQVGSRCKEVVEASAFSIYKFPNFNTCRQCLLNGSDYCMSSDGCVPRGQNACRGGSDHITGHCPENSKYWNEDVIPVQGLALSMGHYVQDEQVHKAPEDEGHTGNIHLIFGIVVPSVVPVHIVSAIAALLGIVSAIAALFGCASAYLCIRLRRAERKLRTMGKGEPEFDKLVAKPVIQDPSVFVKPIAKPATQDPSVVVGIPLAHDDANQQTITNGEVIIEVPLTPRLPLPLQ
jgi:hypothetical protein